METQAPSFKKDKNESDDFRAPNVNLRWRDCQDGPGDGEKTKIAFLRQGFVLAVQDRDGNTMSMCFVPRPERRWRDED